jgi:hypothetical protein
MGNICHPLNFSARSLRKYTFEIRAQTTPENDRPVRCISSTLAMSMVRDIDPRVPFEAIWR